MPKASVAVKKVTATDFREKLRDYLQEARANTVVLVENRRQRPKYLVDKEFLDSLLNERESILATLEVLADRELTDRLLNLSKTIGSDVRAGRLLKMADVFENEEGAKGCSARQQAGTCRGFPARQRNQRAFIHRRDALETLFRDSIHDGRRSGYPSP